jgi:type IV pilus assembly protein PilB
MSAHQNLGSILIAERQVDEVQLHAGLGYQRRWGGKLGQALVALGYLSEQGLIEALSRQLGVPFVSLEQKQIPQNLVRLLSERTMREKRFIPFALEGATLRKTLCVAMATPTDLSLVDEIGFLTGKPVKAYLASEKDIDRALDRHGAARDVLSGGPIELPDDEGEMELVGRGIDRRYKS